MANLFDADTQLEALLARQRERNVAQQEQFGQLFGAAAGNRRQAAVNTIGAQIGASFGQGLSSGLLDEPAEIKRAREAAANQKEVMQKLGKIKWDDPSQLAEASRLLFPLSPEAGIRTAESAIKLSRDIEAAKQKQKDRYASTFIDVKNANPYYTNEEVQAETLALLEGLQPRTLPQTTQDEGLDPNTLPQTGQGQAVATPLADDPLVPGESINAPPRQEGPGVLDTAGSLAGSAMEIGGNLYNKAVDSVSQAMTSLDEFFSGGGTASNAFNFDSYLQSKGVNKAALTPEQLNALYMQGKEEYKNAFQGRVRDQAQGTVKNILPTK